MKKKLLITLLAMLMVGACAIGLAACGFGSEDDAHKHTYAMEWSYDETYHWHAATCEHTNEVGNKAEHSWDNGVITAEPTCTETGTKTYTCTVCDATKTETVSATGHTYSEEWSYDETYHWHAATCEHTNEISDKAEHSGDNGVCLICGQNFTSNDLDFTLNDRKTAYIVTGIGNYTDTDILIPAEYKGLPVSEIAPNAFWGNTNITEISISENVTFIGNNAFQNCTNLKEISILGNEIEIGEDIFLNCTNIVTASVPVNAVNYIPANNLQTLVVTNGTLNDGALSNFTHLTALTIPTLTTLKALFGDNKSTLQSITVLECTEIEQEAFKDFISLNQFTLPKTIVKIGRDAFTNTAYYNNGANWVFNVCYLDNYLIGAAESISGSYRISDGTLVIANYAFKECTSLKSVIIPGSMTSIGGSAFSGCSGLTSITIPNSVTSIGGSAFSGCSGLTSITIPDSVTSIGLWAFENCGDLKEVHITDLAAWCAIEFDGYLANPLNYAQYLYLNNELVRNLVIPDGVTSIGNYAFYNYNGLTSITIPDSVTSIGGWAFYGCTGLTSIVIPDSVTSIGDHAFYNCGGLTNVMIGSNVKSIGGGAFYGCNGLIEINYNAEACEDLDQSSNAFSNSGQNGDGITVNIGVTVTRIPAYLFNPNINTSSISPTITVVNFAENSICESIGNYAFYNCSTLTSIAIPDSVTSIGSFAFRGCSGLTSIVIPDSVTSIGNYAFSNCSGLTNVTIGSNVTSIGRVAFWGCSSLESIIIPDSVTSIGDDAFHECSRLTNVIFENLNGWQYYTSSTATSGSSISDSNLADPSTAAIYLTSTYADYYWRRG